MKTLLYHKQTCNAGQ